MTERERAAAEYLEDNGPLAAEDFLAGWDAALARAEAMIREQARDHDREAEEAWEGGTRAYDRVRANHARVIADAIAALREGEA